MATFTRNLKRYMIGEDVRAVKDKLLELGYLSKVTHNMYGNDTYRAVIAFQNENGLEADGIVGILTWNALMNGDKPEPSPAIEIPDHIGATARAAIGRALTTVSSIRQQICLTALDYTIDPYNNPKSMRAFYIRGGNLYRKDLTLNVMTQARLKSYFNRSEYEPYFDGGRREEILREAAASNYTIPGADCSGTIVGLWIHHGVQSSGFDANANKLYSSYCIQTTSPKPGDLAWRSGHIGLVVGGGYIVENVGGAYGLQLTKMNDRRCFNFVDKKIHKFSKWSAYGDPKKY